LQKIKRFGAVLVGTVLLLGYPGTAAAGWSLAGGKFLLAALPDDR